MKQIYTTKEVCEMPAYRFIWFLQRLGMATIAMSAYVTTFELGPRLHNRTFTILHKLPLLGMPIPVQILILAMVLGACHSWKLKKHPNMSQPIEVGSLTVDRLVEVLSPELIGVLLGGVCYFPVYLWLDVFRV